MGLLPKILASLALLVMLACAPSYPFQQEPITDMAFLPVPNQSNPVAFGAKLHDRPDLQAIAVAQIASVTRGRLPGVRFMVLHYPVYDEAYGWVTSFRNPSEHYIVLSWKGADGFKVEDASWEIEHLVAGTDDDGNPLR